MASTVCNKRRSTIDLGLPTMDVVAELTIHLRMFDDGCKNYTDGNEENVESTFNQVKI